MDGTADQAAASLAGEMGGSGAPANEAPQTGSESGSGSAPAWTNQLSREIRDNADAFGKIANFKTISELADAYVRAGQGLSDEELLHKLGVPKPDEPYGIEDKLG